MNIFVKLLSLFNCLALMLVIQSANTACLWNFHQPEFPEEAIQYKRVKIDDK